MAKSYISRLLLATVCTTLVALTAVAADPSAPLSEDDVTLQKIKTVFDAAFLKSEFTENGKLRIEDDSLKTFVRIDKENKRIVFFSLWEMKEGVPEIEKLQLVNAMNDKIIMVRFCMPRPTILWCDYHFLYEGGITPYAIVNNYRIFAYVTKLAVATEVPEHIIGSESPGEQQGMSPRRGISGASSETI